MPFNILIDHTNTDRGDQSSRSSSYGDDGDSSGDTGDTGVHLSHSHSPRSPSSAVDPHDLHEDGGWVVYPDDIGPSDSASRPQTSNRERPIIEAPQPEEATRHPSYRRRIKHDRVRTAPSPRVRRSPPSTERESVDSHEDWQGYAQGPPHHFSRQYAHFAPGYPPSHYQTYPQQSLVPINQQQVIPYGFAPYQSAPGIPAPNYFAQSHHHGNPHMVTSPGGTPYSPPSGYYPFPQQGYPMSQHIAPHPGYQPYPPMYSPPPPPVNSPPPSSETSNKDDEKFARLEKLLIDQKEEQAAKEKAALKVASDKASEADSAAKRAAELKAAADSAAAAAKDEAEKEYRAAEEKKLAQKEAEAKMVAEIKAASEAAAAAAKEEAEKQFKAAKAAKVAQKEAEAKRAAEIKAAADAAAAAAKEEAEKEYKAIEEKKTADAAAAPPPPPPKENDKPIKFKDAVGRKFSFPFHLCATWSGMEYLIKEAFVHLEGIGPHVAEGHYDLLGPHGDIILPHVWETVIQPDWTITMHMWPMTEEKEEEAPIDPEPDIVAVEEGVPPPPPPVLSALGGVASDAPKKKKPPQPTGFMFWTAGKKARKGKGKKK